MQKLISSRLYFRKLEPKDATTAYAAWLNDPMVNQYLEVRHAIHSIESCQKFIADMNASENHHLFGLFLQEGNQHIGNIKLGFTDRYASGQLSLFIGERSAWGKGYATEAIRCITEHGFVALALERIEAGCYEDNLASLRAFLKAGYQVEGFLRKNVIFEGKRASCFRLAALRREWHASNI